MPGQLMRSKCGVIGGRLEYLEQRTLKTNTPISNGLKIEVRLRTRINRNTVKKISTRNEQENRFTRTYCMEKEHQEDIEIRRADELKQTKKLDSHRRSRLRERRGCRVEERRKYCFVMIMCHTMMSSNIFAV